MSRSEFFEEMKALVLCYGVDSCEEALNAVKFAASQPQGITETIDSSTILEISEDRQALRILMKKIMNGSFSKKLSIRLRDDHPFQVQSGIWHEFFSKNFGFNNPSSGNQQFPSRFYALYIDFTYQPSFRKLAKYRNGIALFDKVFIENIIDVDIIADLVDKGAISSLHVRNCVLDNDEGKKLAKMLEVNLQSMELPNTEVLCQSFVPALMHSLYRHIETFAEGSTLRDLDLHHTLGDLDKNTFGDVLHVIGTLPHLKTFGIQEPDEPDKLQLLVGALGNWKVTHFKLWYCTLPLHDGLNMQPLFDIINNSRYLKKFSVCGNGIHVLSVPWPEQLLRLTLSRTSGLLEIRLSGLEIRPNDLSSLVPEDSDPAIAYKRRLQRFCVASDGLPLSVEVDSRYGVEVDMQDQVLLGYLRNLLRLLSRHLPYVYDIGPTARGWLNFRDDAVGLLCHHKNVSELLRLLNEVWVQLERNRVGMALLHSEVLPTVPGGLWSKVLHRAITCEENPAEVPWTGIFHMVRALVGDGHIGKRSKEEAPTFILFDDGTRKRRREES